MKYKRLPIVLKYSTSIFCWLSLATVPLSAEIDHEVDFGASDRVIEDYINNTYNMTIDIVFTDDDRTDYNLGEATLQM